MNTSQAIHTKTAFYENIVALFAGDSGSSKGLGLAMAARSKDWAEVVNQSIDPTNYQTPLDFLTDYSAMNLLRKAADLPLDVKRKEAAFEAFKTAETRCRETNIRIGKFGATFREEGFEQIISIAQRKIGSILHDFSYVAALRGCYQGSGSTVSIKLPDAGYDIKYDESRISVTRDALALARVCSMGVAWPLARDIPADGPTSMPWEWQLVNGDKLSYVPKTAKTDRTITVGPTVNIYLQLGVGDYLRKCLLRAHIDITDQGVNSGLARQASLFDNLATVDLESASDSLSYSLVQLLLPPDLFRLLDTLRSKGYTRNKAEGFVPYEKFSGMGNGFTFPLQTLIYWGLACAVCEEQGLSREVYGGWLGVFGDDIIVPSSVYNRLLEVLTFCGLKTNERKSYASGPFRESCGGQYFLGEDVRPATWEGFENGRITPWEIARLAHSIHLVGGRMRDLGSRQRFTRVLGFLRQVYETLCRSGEYGEAAKRKPPLVHPDCPAGSGFPDETIKPHSEFVKIRAWVFEPLKRPGRDGAVYASFLNQMERRPKKPRVLEFFRHDVVKLDKTPLPYEGFINVPKSGRWVVRTIGHWTTS